MSSSQIVSATALHHKSLKPPAHSHSSASSASSAAAAAAGARVRPDAAAALRQTNSYHHHNGFAATAVHSPLAVLAFRLRAVTDIRDAMLHYGLITPQ